MAINNLFIIEYEDGEIDDAGDNGGFTVYLDHASAQEMLDCLDDGEAKIVRFVREESNG